MTQSHPQTSKKDQIATLYSMGIRNIEELASLTRSQPSYVANVLRDANILSGYFDLYTSSDRHMNVYSKFFKKKLGFKNPTIAKHSIRYIDTLYKQFERIEDHAGQHHAMIMALTMRNRALWSNKREEAEIFAKWLRKNLESTFMPSSPGLIAQQSIINKQERRRDIHASR